MHELILLFLDQKKNEEEGRENAHYSYEGNGVALAAAAMSATRVLAVNDEIVQQALIALGVLKTNKVVFNMGVANFCQTYDES